MKRRSLLAGVATGSAVLSGCLGTTELLESDSAPDRPSEVVETEFETDVETDAASGDVPKITAQRSESVVTVEGVGKYGSSSCGYLADRPPDYDSETAVLSVEVTAEQELPEDQSYCGDDLGASPYRFRIRFDEGVPARVEAEHPFEQAASREFS